MVSWFSYYTTAGPAFAAKMGHLYVHVQNKAAVVQEHPSGVTLSGGSMGFILYKSREAAHVWFMHMYRRLSGSRSHRLGGLVFILYRCSIFYRGDGFLVVSFWRLVPKSWTL